MVVGLIGAALLYGDGVITPAISVLSAVEGLKVAAPSLERFVLPINERTFLASCGRPWPSLLPAGR
jgi:K+ transporter